MPEVVQALDDAGRSLGIALASTFNLFDARAVVLGGCFGPLAPWLAGAVRRTLVERSLAARSGSFVVLPSAFGDEAAVRGAAALSLHRVLDAPWIVPEATSAPGGRGDARSGSGAERRRKEVAIGPR
jgi:predicted NBD/HSP70 family sugar kinase